MHLTFLGAAGEVTGSQHLLEVDGARILLDCGLFQGRRAESRRKNEQFRCHPKQLDAVVLSHAHIDHCGNLPGLYRAGFRGSVHSTDATADIAELMLRDSARIQEEDARYLASHLSPGGPAIDPLYDADDVEGLMRRFEPQSFGEWRQVTPNIRLRLSPAGHILGSAIVELEVMEQGETRRVVFTGDLGRRNMPLLVDPAPVESADVLITESTYGSRVHPSASDLKRELLRVIAEARSRGSRVIIPAFSLGRTQQLLYFLNELFNERKLPRVRIFVDSPLATEVTRVFRRYQSEMDEDVQRTLAYDTDVFDFGGLEFVSSREDSMALNRREGAFVVISASGMCEGGRVVHHLKHAVSDPNNTVLLLGYQAPGTLGRQLADQKPYVRIFDRQFPLRAKVEKLDALSAHADTSDFAWWFDESTRAGKFRHAFLVHGEPDESRALAMLLRERCESEPQLPRLYETFEV